MDMDTRTNMDMRTRTDMRTRMDMRTPTGIMESGLVLFLRARSTTDRISTIAITPVRMAGDIDFTAVMVATNTFTAVMVLTSIPAIPGFMDMASALRAVIDFLQEKATRQGSHV